jgi:hypothetical protein
MIPAPAIAARSKPVPPDRGVSPEYLERLNMTASRGDLRNLGLEIRKFQGFELFNEGRLLGLFTSPGWRRTSPRLIVETSASFRPYDENRLDKTWDFFVNSIFGIILANHATKLADASGDDHLAEIRERQREVLMKNEGLIGKGNHIAAPIWDTFASPTAALFLKTDSVTRFQALLQHMLFRHFGLNSARIASISLVASSAFEALQNTKQHAREDLAGNPIAGLRFISLRRMNLDSSRVKAISEIPDSPIGAYLSRLMDRWRRNVPKFLISITVADSGVGIAARMTGQDSIYTQDFSAEREAVLEAMKPTGTSKPQSDEGAGLGLYKILQATSELGGFFLVRTGRACMYRHYIARGDYAFNTDLRSWGQHTYECMGGTSITLLFPWW